MSDARMLGGSLARHVRKELDRLRAIETGLRELYRRAKLSADNMAQDICEGVDEPAHGFLPTVTEHREAVLQAVSTLLTEISRILEAP